MLALLLRGSGWRPLPKLYRSSHPSFSSISRPFSQYSVSFREAILPTWDKSRKSRPNTEYALPRCTIRRPLGRRSTAKRLYGETGEESLLFSLFARLFPGGCCCCVGSLHLYTSDLGTTLPPDLGTYTFTYIGFRQNRLRYYMINGTKVHQ